jgi:hypothetical protein
LAENEKAHQSAMEIIAKEMRFLDVVLNVQRPNGVEVKATVRLDTVRSQHRCLLAGTRGGAQAPPGALGLCRWAFRRGVRG